MSGVPAPVAATSCRAAVIVARAIDALAAAGIGTARADAEWLLAGLMDTGRLEIYLDRDVPDALIERYEAAVRRRVAGEPVQHILGWEDFRGLRLRLSADVLIPRPETEALVEWALELLPQDGARTLVVDVGTGSGAIACALAHERENTTVIALDISEHAARVARENATACGAKDHIDVVVADLLSALRGGSVDAVVSNPPYLSTTLLNEAPREVREHDPRLALWAGEDGLGVIDPLIRDARSVLKPGAPLVIETAGDSQVDAVAALFASAGYEDIAIRADLAGVRRFVSGRSPRVPSARVAGAIEGGRSKGAVAPVDETRWGVSGRSGARSPRR